MEEHTCQNSISSTFLDFSLYLADLFQQLMLKDFLLWFINENKLRTGRR